MPKSKYYVNCRICRETHTILADEADVYQWQDGGLIQDIMPYLTASERELLISGTCGVCFDEMFPPYEG